MREIASLIPPIGGTPVLHRYEVGKPYSPSRSQWPEMGEYNYRDGGHELRLFLASPSPQEIKEIGTGRAEFALLGGEVAPDVLFLLYRFGSMAWSDAPYSWHLVEQQLPGQELPPPLDAPDDSAYRALLSVILVDAGTGVIRALRAISFSLEFTRALHRAVREQAARSWPGEGEYNRQLQAAYSRWPSSQGMVNSARVRCVGGNQ